MKRLIALASLVAVATSATSAATTTTSTSTPQKPAVKAKSVAHAPVCQVAPADEYFGKLKMSVLGIRNTIRDQGLLLDVDSTKAPQATAKVNFAEDALHDWEHRYACDRWIPWTIYALEHYYGKIHTTDGVKNVHRIVAWLKRDYPNVGGVISFADKDERNAIEALAAAQTATPTPAPLAAAPSPAPGASAPPDATAPGQPAPAPSGSPSAEASTTPSTAPSAPASAAANTNH